LFEWILHVVVAADFNFTHNYSDLMDLYETVSLFQHFAIIKNRLSF